MTLCNMTIEGGARAGLIAPDETTFDYLMGRPRAPKGGAWEWRCATGRRSSPMPDAHFDREVTLDAAKLPPMVTWGTSPEDVVAITGAGARSGRRSPTRHKRASRERSARLHGPEARPADHRHRARPRLHRLVHQQPHRGPARRREGRRGPQGREPRPRHGRAGLRPGEGRRPRPKGLDEIFHDAGFEWREPGCSMCLGMNPDQLAPRRALRLDLQPQLRGPPGPRRAHPPGLAANGGGGGDRRPFRRHPHVPLDTGHAASSTSRMGGTREGSRRRADVWERRLPDDA